MARPLKKGLSYFPLDTQFWCDRKTQRLKQRYGCDGICVYLSILCEIYGRNGYYADFDSDFCFDIGFTVGLDERRVREIVDFCVHIRLFDGTMLKQQRILTSVGIQSRFEEISKRTLIRIEPAYCLLESAKVSDAKKRVTETKNPVSATKTPPNRNKNRNTNQKQILQADEENQSDMEQGAAARQAELIRMAAEATAGCR